MAQRLKVQWKNMRYIYKPIIYLFILTLWLCWDIYQAHSNSAGVYRSFFRTSSITSSGPATVSIVRSNDPALAHPCGVTDEGITYQTIYEMVQRSVDLAGGLSSIIHTGDTVLIKPNIVQQDSSGSGGVTDIRVVKALVYMVDAIDHGNIKIIVGDGSPRPFTYFERNSGTTATRWNQLFDVPGYQLLKTEALAAGIDFRISNLNGNHDTDPWPELDTVSVQGGGYAQPQAGKYFIHKDVTHASVYINVPVMKVHQQTGFTASLKNQIGLAASSRYGFSKTAGVTQDGRIHKLTHQAQLPLDWQDDEAVDLSIIARIKLNVIDAINCLDSNKSPHYSPDLINTHISNRIKMNTIIAGYDPVAVDNVCCRLMGLNPDDIEHITLAERAGLGTNNSDNITVVGTSIASTKIRFRKSQVASVIYGQSNRIWLLNGTYSTSGIPSPMNFAFIANENSVAPVAGVDGWSQPVYFTNDQIMLKDYYGLGSQSVVSYAFTYFNAPAAQNAQLWVGSDEALKIYLNGTVVYNYASTRTFAGTEFYKDTVSINLQQGLNKLLVKSYQSTGNYNFSLNICESESNINYRGTRILGLKFTTTGAPPLVPPAAPQNLSGVAGNGQVALRWNKNAETNISKYRIYHSLSSPASTLIDSTSSVTDTVKIITSLTNGIAHYFRVTAVNNTSLESEFSNEVSATPFPSSGVDINISQGWNLISVPLIQTNDTANVIFPGKYGAMFGYDQTLGDYIEAPILTSGLGYWVYYISGTTVSISGTIPDSITIACKAGWNLIGSRETEIQVSELRLSTGSIYGSAFRYDTGIGDYAETTVIPPGQGIWLYVTANCTLTIP